MKFTARFLGAPDLPEPVEQLVTCPRCGYQWDWHANQIARCPNCKMSINTEELKAHFRDKSRDIIITPEDVKAFTDDEKSEVEALIKHGRRRE